VGKQRKREGGKIGCMGEGNTKRRSRGQRRRRMKSDTRRGLKTLTGKRARWRPNTRKQNKQEENVTYRYRKKNTWGQILAKKKRATTIFGQLRDRSKSVTERRKGRGVWHHGEKKRDSGTTTKSICDAAAGHENGVLENVVWSKGGVKAKTGQGR